MSKIIIKKPVGFKMELVETDDYIPSLKMQVDIDIEHPTGCYKYHANDIWFECSKWDNFANGLIDINLIEKLILRDMSEQFLLSIEKKSDNSYLFELSCSEPETGTGLANLSFSKMVDSDKLSQILNSFRDFPKWW